VAAPLAAGSKVGVSFDETGIAVVPPS